MLGLLRVTKSYPTQLRNTIPPSTTIRDHHDLYERHRSQDSTDQPLWGPEDINQDQLFYYLPLTDKTLSYGTTNNFNPQVSYKSLGTSSGTTDKHDALHFQLTP